MSLEDALQGSLVASLSLSLRLSLPEPSVTKDSSSPRRSYHRNSLPPFHSNPLVTLAGSYQDRKNPRPPTPPLSLLTRTPRKKKPLTLTPPFYPHRKKTTLVRYPTSSLPPFPFPESLHHRLPHPSTPPPSSLSHRRRHHHHSSLAFPHPHP